MGEKVGSASKTSSVILFLALTAIILTSILTYNAYPRSFAQTEEPSLTMKARGPYYDGDVVNVTGQVNDPNEKELRQYEGRYVNFTHYDPDGKIVMEKAVGILSNGTFSYSFTAEQMWGYQRLVARYLGNGLNLAAEVKFYVRLSVEQPDLSQLPKQEAYFVIEGQVYKVLYQSKDIGITLEPRIGAIKIRFYSSEDSAAILEIPRKLIDSKDSEGNDINFLAYSKAGKMLPVIHIANSSDTRTIMMDYTKPSGLGDGLTLFLVGTEMAEVKELPALTASLDKPTYEPGDTALITGSIAVRSGEFPITMDILNASGAVVFSKPISHDYFGDFSLDIPILNTLAEIGHYSISIQSLQRSVVLDYSVGIENDKSPVSLLHVSTPEFVTNGSFTTRAGVGEQLSLKVRVNSSATVLVSDLELSLIFEVRDSSNGLTQFIAMQSDILTDANPAIEFEVPWQPEYESKFELRTFVIAKQGFDAFVSSVQTAELTAFANA